MFQRVRHLPEFERFLSYGDFCVGFGRDLELLVDSISGAQPGAALSLVVGLLGPVAPPSVCAGRTLPVVGFDQLFSFDPADLIRAIPIPEGAKADEFTASARELLERILQMTDNTGATDENRALNYLAVRYPAVYAQAHACHARSCSLTAVEVRKSTLGGVRKVLEVIFSFAHRATDVVEKYFVRVDVSEEFPFLVTKLSPYYDR